MPGGGPARAADPPDQKLPALYGKLDSADAMNDPEALVSWHLTAGRAEEGWPDMFLSTWRDGGCGIVEVWWLWARRERLSVSV